MKYYITELDNKNKNTVVIDDTIHGRVQPNKFPKLVQDLQKSEAK